MRHLPTRVVDIGDNLKLALESAEPRPVNMIMRSLAIDLAPLGITCVVVNPGWVRTDMGGANATLEPAESISRMRRLIATLGLEQSGKFFNHTGREYPW